MTKGSWKVWLEPSKERRDIHAEISEYAAEEGESIIPIDDGAYLDRLRSIRESLDDMKVDYSVTFDVEDGRAFALITTIPESPKESS